ncbi:MAG: site-specific integrase [Bacillaceae bacterium]|nr:site-specific integrase [Bacillaceae bacterium]
MKYGLIQKNPVELVDAPRPQKKEMKTWNEEEVRQFLDVAESSRYYIVYLLAVTTGMRRGEILGLRWQDIDFKLKTLSIKQTLSNRGDEFQETKTSSGNRSVSLPTVTIEQLKKHKKMIAQEKLLAGNCYVNLDLVVCTSLGNKLHPRNLLREFKRLTDLAEVAPIRFHDLRHTHATLMLKQGVHPKIVSERLGHSNIKITLDTYTHVLPGLQQAAAEKFGEVLLEKAEYENRIKDIKGV